MKPRVDLFSTHEGRIPVANSVSVLPPECTGKTNPSFVELFIIPLGVASSRRPGTLRPPVAAVLFRSHFATLPSQLDLLEAGADC